MQSITPTPETPTHLSSVTLLVLAVATGLCVSSIYLNQTLLNSLAYTFRQSPSSMGLVATLTQLGYAAGILFLVPMGDIVEKRKLVLSKLIILSVALLLVGFSYSFLALLFSTFAVGVFGSTAQDFVPLATDLSAPSERGRTIGTVMSGLLIGILASRTVSGFIATALSWRFVFWIFGFLILILLAVVAKLIPEVPPKSQTPYRVLLRNLQKLFAAHPRLRSSMRTHCVLGIGFSAFWTNLSFYLSGSPFHLTASQIGMFGLAGAAGALAAPVAGRLSDKNGPMPGIYFGIACVGLSFLGMWIFQGSLWSILVGTVVFDLGIQMSLISHQTIIYSLDHTARSSINAIFITGLFLAFAFGSAVSAQLMTYFGWSGVLLFSLGTSCCALLSALAVNRKAL